MNMNEKCTWSVTIEYAEVEGNWETSCSKLFLLNDGTPSENKMAYCCFCGKIIDEKITTLNINGEEIA